MRINLSFRHGPDREAPKQALATKLLRYPSRIDRFGTKIH